MKLIGTSIAMLIIISTLAAQAQLLHFPLSCTLGKDCWIVNLQSHYSKERQLDFLCGQKTYNGHKGTDFALRDVNQMLAGVKVLSPIDGIIETKHNDFEDINSRIQTEDNDSETLECGNGVVITNKNIEAKLCHLKKGSIHVSIGEKVNAGDVIGEIGLSCKAQYPHLHIEFRKNINGVMKEVDPFYGDQPNCGLPPKSMWKEATLMHKHAKTGIIYNYGFAFDLKNAEQVRTGIYNRTEQKNRKKLVGFVDIFSAKKGDVVKASIISNKNEVILARSYKFTQFKTRYFFYIEKSLREKQLSGKHTLKIQYIHSDGKIERLEQDINL